MPKSTPPPFLPILWIAGTVLLAGCHRPAAPETAAHSPGAISVAFGEGFMKEETTPAAVFRWAHQTASAHLTVPEAGRYLITFRLITVFSPKENTIEIRVNDEKIGDASTHTFDFAKPTTTALPATLKAGDNEVALKSNAPEIQLGQDDPRTSAFGLIMPVGVEPVR